MKTNRLIFSLFLFTISFAFPQGKSQIGLSGFYVNETGKKKIGFTSLELSYPLVIKEHFELRGGLQFIGAATGIRGGYFAFGYSSQGVLFPNKRIQLGLNASLLAGGGASAPDKDGWMIHGALFTQFSTKKQFKVRAGVSYNHVSSSIIKGFSPYLGLSWDLNLKTKDSDSSFKLVWQNLYTEFAIGKEDSKTLGFVGAAASWNIGRYIGGDASIHAIANTYGGYMQTLFSAGPKFKFWKMNLLPGPVLGLGGGGAAKTGGGALIGYQLALNYDSKIHLGLKYQQIIATGGSFHYNAIFFSVGKEITNSNFANLVKWYPIAKVYGTNNRFGNLGARFIAFESKYIKLMGSTFWAFTDNKGAYAEGLFELSAHAPKNIPLYSVVSIGAGAGAGINKKTESLIYAASLGINSPWKKLPLAIEFGLWKGGNIPSYSFSLIYYPKFLRNN